MSKQADGMQGGILETQAAVNALEELSTGSKHDALIPIGAGAFIHGKIDAVDKVMIAIGTDIVVKEDMDKSKKLLEQRITDMESLYTKLLKDIGSITAQIQSILPEIESLAGEMNYSDSKK